MHPGPRLFARRDPDHLHLALAHRLLQRLAILTFVMVVVAPFALGLLAPAAVARSPITWQWWSAGVLASFAVLGAQTLRVAWLSGAGHAEIAIAAVGLCIPGINLAFIIGYDNRAATLITIAGARVGLLGAGERELPRIAGGRCVRCDYDLRGIDSPSCPECGHDTAAPKIPGV